MIDDFDISTILSIKEMIVIPTVYLLCAVIIYAISTLLDSLLVRKEDLSKKQKTIINLINIIVLPIQFLALYIGFFSLFRYYLIVTIYLPLIIVSALICSTIKSLYIKKHLNLKIFGKMFWLNIISSIIWMLVCSFLIVQLAYYN